MNYDPAFKKACRALKNILEDPNRNKFFSEKKGVSRDGKIFSIPYMGKEYLFEATGGEGGEFHDGELKMSRKILLLHYVTTGWDLLTDDSHKEGAPRPTPGGPPGRWISFSDLPGANTYRPTYRKRGPLRIISRYGTDPEALLGFSKEPWFLTGEKLSGETYGDVSIGVRAFPRVSVLVVLYRGDEEFPPDGNILFTKDILHHLPLEDVAVLSGEIASLLRC